MQLLAWPIYPVVMQSAFPGCNAGLFYAFELNQVSIKWSSRIRPIRVKAIISKPSPHIHSTVTQDHIFQQDIHHFDIYKV